MAERPPHDSSYPPTHPQVKHDRQNRIDPGSLPRYKGTRPLTRERVALLESKVLLALATRTPSEMARGEIQGYILPSFSGPQIDYILGGLVDEGRVACRRERCATAKDGTRRVYALAPREEGGPT